MKENFSHTEAIESYLTGKLSGSERSMFEAAMNKDPLLKNEVALQKDVIQALSDFRKSELKSRLDKIDVSAGSAGTVYGKIAAAVALLALLGTGTFYLTNSDSSSLPLDKPQARIGHSQIMPAEKAKIVSSESPSEVAVEKNRVTVKTQNTVVAQAKPETKAPETEGAINIPLPKITPLSNEAGDINGSVRVPDGDVTSGTSVNSVKPDVAYEKGSRKDFHYKYFNNKLYLYGDFNQNLIEFLELNMNRDKNLYLFYKGDYFLLNQNQIEKTPLQKITDQAVISQLGNL